jgi:hypothetical protein
MSATLKAAAEMRRVRSFERIGSVPSRRQVTYTMLVGRQKNVGNERRPESAPALITFEPLHQKAYQ